MRNQLHHFQLIDGIFTPDQTRQILGALVKSKINYHSLEKLSESELTGNTRQSEQRLQSLRALAAELNILFDSAMASESRLKVLGKFEITLIE